MCDFSRVSAWFCDEKISLKKSCFYLYIRRKYELCRDETRSNKVCGKIYKRDESYVTASCGNHIGGKSIAHQILKFENKSKIVSASNNDVDNIAESLLCYTTPCFEGLT